MYPEIVSDDYLDLDSQPGVSNTNLLPAENETTEEVKETSESLKTIICKVQAC